MHIAVNAHLLSPEPGYRQAGVSTYVEQLLRHMIPLDPGIRWTIFAAPGVTSARIFDSPPGDNVQWRQSIFPTNSPAARILWEQLAAPGLLTANRPDVLFCPVNIVPLLAPCSTVVTIHDVAFLRFDTHRPAKRKYLSSMTKRSARRAAHIIAVSQFTRNEVIELLGVDPNRITAIPNGRDSRIVPQDAQTIEAYRKRKNLPPRFLLTIGTLEPRKNLATLLRAYASVKDRLAMPLLIGGGKGWFYDELFALVRELNLELCVQFLGFVPPDELPLLYSAAHAFVYPSLYEGFGLPLLEAMAAGVPAVSSDAGALQEVVSDAAVCCPATDVQGLADAMVQVTTDHHLRSELRQKGLARSQLFSWDQCSRQTLDVLKSAI